MQKETNAPLGILDIDIDKMHYMIVASFASIFRDHFHLSKKKIQNYRHGDIARRYIIIKISNTKICYTKICYTKI